MINITKHKEKIKMENKKEDFKKMLISNKDISMLDVSNVTDMRDMFNGANSFNQDISMWDVSKVTDMREMFKGASLFNQDISMWDVSKVTYYEGIFDDCPIKLKNMPEKFRKCYKDDISRY
jgi:surface protein